MQVFSEEMIGKNGKWVPQTCLVLTKDEAQDLVFLVTAVANLKKEETLSLRQRNMAKKLEKYTNEICCL